MSIIGNWVGAVVLQVGSQDPVGTPGDLTIRIEGEGSQLGGTIRSGTFLDATLTSIRPTDRGFQAEFPVQFAQQEYVAKASCVVDGEWMWGIIQLGFEMVAGVNFVRVYVKRQNS